MDQSRSCAEGDGDHTSQNRTCEDERQRQQERLSREEAYYQFINELSDEDYRLMRDQNLLGTPGEITAEQLQQRLEGAKDHLASQTDTENRGGLGEASGENSNGDSLLEWLNTFRRTGNATRSGQSGNQTWRAVSRTNPNSGEFRFSLEININHEHNSSETSGEDSVGISHLGNSRSHGESRLQRPGSPVAGRTRSWTLRNSNAYTANPSRIRTVRSSVAQSSEEESHSFLSRLRSRNRGSISFHRTRSSVRSSSFSSEEHTAVRQREIQESASSAGPHRGRTRANFQRGGTQRLEILRLRSTLSSRSRSPLQRQDVAANSDYSQLSQDRNVQQIYRRSSRRHISQPLPQFSNSASSLGITLEEEESSRPTAAVRRHPTITLDLQVRRIRPGENRDRDSIASRTRSRVGMAENTVTFESDSGGFRRTISRSERAGIRTYVSTIRIPLRRISETGLGEPSSVALRSILRQIMTGFGELNSLMETESDHEIQRGDQHLANLQSELSNSHTVNDSSEVSETSLRNMHAEEGGSETSRASSGTQHYSHHNENPENEQSQDANNLVENGTLPILRLAHFFLLNDEEDDENLRGLTKEQIDNLSTRNYGDSNAESEISKTCSVCINEYATGNKLRQLPCLHEFHVHCIDRWLSENSTCPICRQPVLGHFTAENG
uniref:RING-type E3 ubiquitin transferase n=1 Tax=Sphenodon punctatus TaxID=8508 RepID=A0A8D0H178_SPHPU